jgi:hypothetical protein
VTTDPFTASARAILAALRAGAGFTSIVPAGNLIDMTADTFERFKTTIQSGDTPEVVLLQEAFRLAPFTAGSRAAEIDQTFQLIATHDSLRAVPLNALKFQTLLALAGAGPSLGLEGLVRQWSLTDARDDAFGPKQWRRGTERWVSILSIEVGMYLSRDRLASGG